MSRKKVANVEGEKDDYMRITFWVNPSNWFWEDTKDGLSHTEASKEYFRQNLAARLRNPHEAKRVENMASKT